MKCVGRDKGVRWRRLKGVIIDYIRKEGSELAIEVGVAGAASAQSWYRVCSFERVRYKRCKTLASLLNKFKRDPRNKNNPIDAPWQ
ncbi:hypothetical protein CANCADRAFT_124036 [Tortispora caseinolytica NRRL Y-17796]|uniref:Uncharacterized protein n=1 Tax=Tortispora caseinolytica NRRL Y-17796 TaxID=767744 RepID=A0A1E4T9U2_9ASCO|nr:hypothetical protein CANCADRAFT_124036 [Tortispora caseinolytica NRRL Y-17796]